MTARAACRLALWLVCLTIAGSADVCLAADDIPPNVNTKSFQVSFENNSAVKSDESQNECLPRGTQLVKIIGQPKIIDSNSHSTINIYPDRRGNCVIVKAMVPPAQSVCADVPEFHGLLGGITRRNECTTVPSRLRFAVEYAYVKSDPPCPGDMSHWVYSQTTGILCHDHEVVAFGYSGAGPGLNNRAFQDIASQGPIPQGEWTIGVLSKESRPGDPVFPVIPVPGTDTFGRAYFSIHGGDPLGVSETASTGAIILDRAARLAIAGSDDRHLSVVP
jgi:hypothetical protein